MSQTILGIFESSEQAEAAIKSLENKDYNPKDISIVMKDHHDGEVLAKNTGADVSGGAVSGATTGAVVGGIAGLLVGVGLLAIPGGLLLGGPLFAALGLTGAAATTASGATTGALAGGLIGALVGLGIPKEEAIIYEDQIKSGAILVAVPTMNDNQDEVRAILEDNHATNIRTVTMPAGTAM